MPRLVRAVLLTTVLATAACGVPIMGDLAPLAVHVVNHTPGDLTVRPARPNELPWRVSGANQAVVLAPGEVMTRSWAPDYEHRLRGTDQLTIEAENAQGVLIFCRRYSVDDLAHGLHNTVEIHDADLACQ